MFLAWAVRLAAITGDRQHGTRRRLGLTFRGGLSAYLFVLPSVVFILLFVIVPIIGALYYSFSSYDLLTAPTLNGIKNYQAIATEPRFPPAIRNTVLFAIGTVPAGVITSLLLAVLINRAIRGIYFFRAMFYMPVVSSFVAVSVIFLWMYEPQLGVIGEVLRIFGLPPIKWLRDPDTALLAIILMSIWKNMGLNMVIYLAGLQGIPPHIYEASDIDGAGRLSKLLSDHDPAAGPHHLLRGDRLFHRGLADVYPGVHHGLRRRDSNLWWTGGFDHHDSDAHLPGSVPCPEDGVCRGSVIYPVFGDRSGNRNKFEAA